MTLAMSGATPEDSGLASGVVNTSAQVGGAVGLAVLATLATGRTDDLLAGGATQAAALNSGYHLAYVVGAALVGVALALAIAFLRAPAPQTEHEAAIPDPTAGAEPGLDGAAAEAAYSEAG
jgi:hypothetical protein